MAARSPPRPPPPPGGAAEAFGGRGGAVEGADTTSADDGIDDGIDAGIASPPPPLSLAKNPLMSPSAKPSVSIFCRMAVNLKSPEKDLGKYTISPPSKNK
jgi:hypothetical protein